MLHNKKLKNTIIFFLDKVYYNCHCTWWVVQISTGLADKNLKQERKYINNNSASPQAHCSVHEGFSGYFHTIPVQIFWQKLIHSIVSMPTAQNGVKWPKVFHITASQNWFRGKPKTMSGSSTIIIPKACWKKQERLGYFPPEQSVCLFTLHLIKFLNHKWYKSYCS